MKDLYSTNVQHFRCIILLFLILSSSKLFADGSKDLYPNGITGLRACLRSSLVTNASYPFANLGTHYVYAKAGERIAIASSAQNIGVGEIKLYAPSGNIVLNSATNGQIPNRTAELAGPLLFGELPNGNKYTPNYYQIPNGGEGVYKIEFISTGTNQNNSPVVADANWNQSSANFNSHNEILAWDISVINQTNSGFISGRVYSNVLNFNMNTASPSTTGFYGKLYALTKDGYTYRINNNGINGLFFTFFVNNNGFINPTTGLPIYKSLNNSTPASLSGKVHDPNSADTSTQITHKMFYTLPSTDLPTTSVGAVPGGTTWLKNRIVVPQVSNISTVGVEGTPGQFGNLKGGYIKFDADVQGTYEIKIEVPGFTSRTLTGPSSAGNNKIYWDGKDGAGIPITAGTLPLNLDVTVKLQMGEVHFPFIDMEFNIHGFILELLDDNNLNQVLSDIVYWDDSDISNTLIGEKSNPINNSHLSPANSLGISSTSNGHKWGAGATSNSNTFGDNRAMDTWTFVKGQQTTVTASVILKNADLMVSSLTANKLNILLGEDVTYTIKVKNDGPSDVNGAKFSFTIPQGYSPQNISFNGAGYGSEINTLALNTTNNTFTSTLNLPSGCEITYLVTLIVNNLSVEGNQNVKASILRTNDISDPDATDSNINNMPTDAQSECTNNGLGGSCNNIKTNNSVYITLACRNAVTNTGVGISSNHGITLLKRAGKENGNWPLNRNSAHTVLESNTKGLVITRIANPAAAITNPVEGMMVYDTTEKCLKLYSDGIWSCFSNPACP